MSRPRVMRPLFAVAAAALLIAIVAVPSFGASKQSVLEVTPHSAIAGASFDTTVTITNTTPGNSTINSASINVPFPLASGSSVTAQVLPPPDPPGSTNPNSSATVTVVGSQVRVQNIDSLKTDQHLRVRVTATPAALPAGTCNQNYLWTATAYAGNSLNGDQFPNQGTVAQRTVQLLSLEGSCSGIRFVDGHTPQDAVLNTTITNTDLEPGIPPAEPVQVEYILGGVRQDLDTGTVTLSYGTTPASPLVPGELSGNTATFSNGLAEFPNLKISDTPPFDAAGDYTLIATYSTYTTESPSFRIFDALICDGDTYTEGAQTDAGQFTITSQTSDCFGIIVNNFTGNTGTGNVDEWSVIKSLAGGNFIQGTFDINWDLGDGTDPVPWTQVTWEGLSGYHDVQLCNPGWTETDPWADLFPGTEQTCLLESHLVDAGDHWEQQERFAYNTDWGARK